MIKSKRLFAAGLAAALVLAACGGDDDDSGDGGDGGQRVGLAFDTGGRGDGTFNDAAGRGATLTIIIDPDYFPIVPIVTT